MVLVVEVFEEAKCPKTRLTHFKTMPQAAGKNNTVLLLASGHLSHAFGISWLCFLAGWAENWAKLYMQLPISAIL